MRSRFRRPQERVFRVSLTVHQLDAIPVLHRELYIHWSHRRGQPSSGRTPARGVESGNVIRWNVTNTFSVTIPSESSDATLLQPSPLLLQLRSDSSSRWSSYDTEGSVELDISELATNTNTVSRNYLVQNSPFNTTLKLSVRVQHHSGDKIFRTHNEDPSKQQQSSLQYIAQYAHQHGIFEDRVTPPVEILSPPTASTSTLDINAAQLPSDSNANCSTGFIVPSLGINSAAASSANVSTASTSTLSMMNVGAHANNPNVNDNNVNSSTHTQPQVHSSAAISDMTSEATTATTTKTTLPPPTTIKQRQISVTHALPPLPPKNPSLQSQLPPLPPLPPQQPQQQSQPPLTTSLGNIVTTASMSPPTAAFGTSSSYSSFTKTMLDSDPINPTSSVASATGTTPDADNNKNNTSSSILEQRVPNPHLVQRAIYETLFRQRMRNSWPCYVNDSKEDAESVVTDVYTAVCAADGIVTSTTTAHDVRDAVGVPTSQFYDADINFTMLTP